MLGSIKTLRQPFTIGLLSLQELHDLRDRGATHTEAQLSIPSTLPCKIRATDECSPTVGDQSLGMEGAC